MEKLNCRINSVWSSVCALVTSAEKLFMGVGEKALSPFLGN